MRTPVTATGTGTGTTTATARAGLFEPVLAGGAALLLLAFSTVTYAVYWAPKAAVLLLAVVPGAVALVRLARHRIPGARLAAAFLAVAGLSTLLADRRWLSLLGDHNWGTGWLFLVASLGLWALGVTAGERGARLVEAGILVGALGCAAFAWIQSSVSIPVDVLAGGARATGFLGNPVHLGAVAGGGLALVGLRLREDARPGWWPAAAFVLAGALQLSGSRAALVPAAAFVLWLLTRLGRRRGAVFAAAVVAGVLLAGLAPEAGKGNATERAAVSLDPGSSSGRTAVWRASVEAVGDRPAFGWGPARTRPAVSPRVDPQVASNEGRGAEYTDAHNLFLEVGVTTGLAGLALFCAWLVAAGRAARGPLAGFAAVGAVVGLAQPLSVAVTPVLALALGASRRRRTAAEPVPSPFGESVGRAVAAAGTVAAVAVAGVFLAGEVALGGAALDFSRSDLRTADRLLPPWPAVHDLGWRVHAFAAIATDDPAEWDAALASAAEAVREDPSVATAWVRLGDLRLRRGNVAEAARAYEEARRRHPWSVAALNGTIAMADRRGDDEAVRDLCAQRARVVDPEDDAEGGSGCLETVRRLYAD